MIQKLPIREHCYEQFEKDRDKLEQKIAALQKANDEVFDRVEAAMLAELRRERERVGNLIRQINRVAEDSLRHNHWISLWLAREDKSIPTPLYGAESVLKVLFHVSSLLPQDRIRWEEASAAFLIPSVFQRTLEEDSQGYLPEEPMDPESLLSLCALAGELVPTIQGVEWETLVAEVKEFWRTILPDIYGGEDPLWQFDETLTLEEAQNWRNNEIFQEVLERVR